jgi:SH3-like domain-containing protein
MLRVLLALALFAAAPASAQTAGPSGLPVPRFVSLKADRVNVRQGPTRDHQVVWQFTRAALPVEITAEFENWRRIRDADGSEGWVLQGLLSGRRTALVAPWRRGQTFDLRTSRGGGEVRARLEAGVLVSVRACAGGWCRVTVDSAGSSVDGWVEQAHLWGVYPNETIE